MPEYPLRFPVEAGSPTPLNNIAKAAEQIAQQTKLGAGGLNLFNQSLKQGEAAGLSYTNNLKETLNQFGKMGGAARNFSVELKSLIDAENKAAVASQRFGNSIHTGVVAPVTAASGAIRVLEGSQSIRVVENLLAKTLGLGPAFQAAFPIFGAIAMTEMLGQMVEKVGKLYNTWDPVVQAQERALRSMKELNAEYNKLSGDSQKRIYDAIENRTGAAGGRAERLRAEGRDAAKDAVYQDAARIQTTLAQIEAAQKRVTAGTNNFTVGAFGAILPGKSLTRDAQAARVDLQRLDAELENARKAQSDDLAKAKDFTGQAGKEDARKAKESAEGRLRIEKEIESILGHSAELRGKAKYQDFGRVGEVMARRETMGRDYDRQLKDLDAEQKINPQFKTEYDQKRAAIGVARKDDTVALNAELLKAVFDQADAQAKARGGIERELARGRASMAQLQGERTSAIDLAAGRLEPGSRAGIEKAAKDREAGIRRSFQEEIQPLREISTRLAREPKSDERTTRMRDEVSRPFAVAVDKANQDLFKSETQRRTELAAAEKSSADQRIALQDRLRKMQEEADKQNAETSTRMQAALATSGMTGAQKITTTAAFDLQGAARSRDAQLKDLGPIDTSQAMTAELSKKIEDAARISYEFKEKERQIGAQMVEQLESERQRQADSHSSTFASGIIAAATHSGVAFGRGLGRQIGQQMLENFSKNFIFQKGGPFEKLQPSLDGSSMLGKIFDKTGLVNIRGADSPLTAPALKLNAAAGNLNAAADKLQGLPPGSAPTNTTSGFGVGVPGLSSFGSGTSGPSSIASSIKNIFGSKTHTGPGGSGGGTQSIDAAIQTNTTETSTNTAATRELTQALQAMKPGAASVPANGAAGAPSIAASASPAASGAGSAVPPSAAISSTIAALNDSTQATQNLANVQEYIATGGASGSMPDGTTPDLTSLSAQPTASTRLTDMLAPLYGADISQNAAPNGSNTGISGLVAGLGAAAGAAGITASMLGKFGGPGNSPTPFTPSGGNGAGIVVTGGASAGSQASPSAKASVSTGGGSGAGGDILKGVAALAVAAPVMTSISKALTSNGTIGTTGLRGFMSGTGMVGSSGLMGALTGTAGDASNKTLLSTSQRIGASATAVGELAAGTMTAINQFNRGGAKGALGGTSAVLGMASMIPGPQQPFVMAAAMITGLVSSILGDPKVKRENQIQKTLFNSQYQQPASQNIQSSTRGTYADLDLQGDVRQSNLSPYVRSTSAFLDYVKGTVVPSEQTSQFGGGGPITVNIHTLDGPSLGTYLKNNSSVVLDAVAHGMTFGHSPVTAAIKGVIGQG